MRAGPMRYRVVVEEPLVAQDERGAEVITWKPMCVTWAQVRTLSAREMQRSELITPQATYTVTMRWRKGITSKHRLRWRDKRLAITGVMEPDPRMRMLEIMAYELVGDNEVI